jgi:two-component sensor histidine kinase
MGEQAATTLALVVHELATNSLKYGALSSPTGTLDIACAAHDTEVVLVWTERGGPPVAAPDGEGGYGSKLLNRSMTLQLGGSISCDWSAEGVIVTLHMTKIVSHIRAQNSPKIMPLDLSTRKPASLTSMLSMWRSNT